MDETRNMGEVQETGTPRRRLFPLSNISHCSHEGTGMLPAVVYRVTPVLQTTTTTEVAGIQAMEATGWSHRPPMLAGSLFAKYIINNRTPNMDPEEHHM